MSKHVIVYSLHAIENPLLHGLMLEYLKKIDDPSINFHLISHEQGENSKSNQTKISHELSDKNIHWYPIQYKNGRFLLFKKFLNFAQTFFIITKIKFKFKPKLIIGCFSIAGSFSYIISRIFNLKLAIFSFEPHSQYMLDFGIWGRNSINFKLLNYFEKIQIKKADFLTLPTSHTIELANSLKSKAKIYKVPTTIDVFQFDFDAESRKNKRVELKIEDKIVILYMGKFDGIYYSIDETLDFFRKLHEVNNNYFFYIITDQAEEVKLKKNQFKLNDSNLYVSNAVKYADLSSHICIADFGLNAVPPFNSQKYRTPFKTAIYLACGIPYIINKGVSDEDELAIKENIGVVINDFKHEEIEKTDNLLRNFLLQNKTINLVENCKQAALKYKHLDLAVSALKEIIKNI